MKKYTLETSAPFEIVRQVAIGIAMQHGHVAELSEAPPELPKRRVWTPGRWWAVVLTLAIAPFVFDRIHVSSLQGFGIGWIVAAIVLLSRR